jgi:purine nucleosidase
MWDTLATSYLAIPEAFTVEKVKANVCERPPNAGQAMIHADGYEITIATEVNITAFYAYILNQFKGNDL